MTDLIAEKKAARAAALAVRDKLHLAGAGAAERAAGHALGVIAGLPGVTVVSAYLPMLSEFDPRPAMLALVERGYRICAPVVVARGQPLRFREWTPGAALERAGFGVEVPAKGDWLEPDALLVPLLCFDAGGWRLGYGGGFYDRTLAGLRARRAVRALGFAYAGQQVASVPRDATDARLDAVVTEAGVLWPA